MARLLEVKDIETLERVIDAYDLPSVLEAIDQICIEKAQHIRENWQDESTARAWDRMGSFVDTAARQVSEHH